MRRAELISRMLILAGIVLAVGAPLLFWKSTPLIHARMADTGGWSPDVLQIKLGEPLHLSLTSDDVMHGFAVGQMDMEAVDIEPGKVTELTLTFDKSGIYTFYCTRWCDVNHWRMRGTIEVTGPTSNLEPKPSNPLYVTLGINIDAPHESPVVPASRPSAARGEQVASKLAMEKFIDPESYPANSPYQVYEELASNGLSDSEKWDLVAYIWQSNTTPLALTQGKDLYAKNCAACHGENGGDGVFADDLTRAGDASMQTMDGAMDMALQAPADFTELKGMLGASPALLQGKILRGGMGTGMPMWGSIFTEEQMWKLIAYIYSFQFEYQK
jgi:mono/diheme cytochrome c family protein/plastocyanin